MDRIDALKLFTWVAETGSFTKAAEISRLPRSTVSAVIQKLESSHNVQLFYRTTRKVHLTQDGSKLLERCRTLLAEMEDIDGLFKRNSENITGKFKPVGSKWKLIIAYVIGLFCLLLWFFL